MASVTQNADELQNKLPESIVRGETWPGALRCASAAGVIRRAGFRSDLATVLKFCGERDLPLFARPRVEPAGSRRRLWRRAPGHPDFSWIEIAGERLHCGAGAKLKRWPAKEIASPA
jgi:hypothetical protein